MSEDAKLPVLASVQAGFTFFTLHWRKFAPGAALAALAVAVLGQALAIGHGGWALIGLFASMAAVVAYRASLFRFALREEFPGPVGLQFGNDEGRLIGIAALYFLFLMLVFLSAFIPMMVVVMGIAGATGDVAAVEAATEAGDAEAILAAMGPSASVAYAIGLALVAGLMLFVWTRLALSAPATIAEQKIVFLKSWPWTKGQFWRLILAIVLAALPGLAGEWLLAAAAGAATAAGIPVLGVVLSFVGLFVGALVGGMMGAGVLAFLYRGLRPSE